LNKPTNLLAHLALFATNFIYAANYSIAKLVMPHFIPPFGFIFLRVMAACILFWLSAVWVRERVEKADIPRLALCGLTGVAINQLLFFKGLNWTTPIHGSLIMLATPILVVIISSILIKEKITWQRQIGIALGCLGALLLILGGKNIDLSSNGLLGDLFIFINATSYAIYFVLVRKMLQKYHAVTVSAWMFSFGLLIVFPIGFSEAESINWQIFTPVAWWSLGFVLFFVTFIAYLCNAYAMRTLSPSVAGAYIYSQPVLATIIAISLGKDSLTIIKIIAAILIFIGVALVSKK
jgi:drug/metabolite transporter (DMT)-like permease